MKATQHLSVLVLALLTAMVDCGGETGKAPGSHTDAGSDANTSKDASASGDANTSKDAGASADANTSKDAGGHSDASSDAAVVPPRAPSSHRAKALSCVGVHSPPEPVETEHADLTECARHADCTEGENGKCTGGIGMAMRWYSCVYDDCETDDDCDPGMVCYCTESNAARCLSIGNCQTDVDCGDGAYSYCSPSMSGDCGGYRPIDGYHCHTEADSCLDDSDCTGNDYCNFDEYGGRWKCTATDQTCIIG